MSFVKFMRYALAWLVLGIVSWYVGAYAVKVAIAVGKQTNGLIGFITFFLLAAVWVWFLNNDGMWKIFKIISGRTDAEEEASKE